MAWHTKCIQGIHDGDSESDGDGAAGSQACIVGILGGDGLLPKWHGGLPRVQAATQNTLSCDAAYLLMLVRVVLKLMGRLMGLEMPTLRQGCEVGRSIRLYNTVCLRSNLSNQ